MDARKIEGELEMKLSQYSRFSAMDSSGNRKNEGPRALQCASHIETEIPALLKRLEEVHTSMEADVSGSDVRHHTVARHREILQDFKQEFHRLSHQVGLVFFRSLSLTNVCVPSHACFVPFWTHVAKLENQSTVCCTAVAKVSMIHA
jgi:hypothetical protein